MTKKNRPVAAGPDIKARALSAIQANRWRQAEEYCLCLTQTSPSDPEAWCMLGAVHGQQGNFDAAIDCCKQAIGLAPDYAEAYFNLAQAFARQYQFEQAAEAYQQTLRLNPDYVEGWHNLTRALWRLGRHSEALDACERALSLAPEHAGAHANHGALLLIHGRYEESERAVRVALRLDPEASATRSQLLFNLHHYCADHDRVFREHLEWQRRHAPMRAAAPARRAECKGQLRVGYVSPDLRTHSVAYFLKPLFEHYDRARLAVFAYADVARPDAMTQELRALCTAWRDIHGMTDNAVIEQIRRDQIDILVDLAGHTANHRLGVFAARAAAVQINYLGYPHSTGLSAMDYRLTDPWADPPGKTDCWHTETLVRLAHGFLCYGPPAVAPPVASLPALTQGHVTFGSFNKLAKITPEVIAVWARLLNALPSARLLIKNRSLQNAPIIARLQQLFQQHGISAERVRLQGWAETTYEHLHQYEHIDIGLDTFPYNGTTTTCEALWMGVPVIAVAGDHHAARVGVSLLNQVRLAEECLGESIDDYIAKAVRLAGDLPALAALRRGLRLKMANSALCDGKGFAERMTQTYQALWAQHPALALRQSASAQQNNALNVLVESGQWQGAAAAAQTLCQAFPHDATAWLMQGVSVMHLSALDHAARCFRTAIAKAPDYADAHRGLGMCLQRLGQSAQALGCLQYAVSLDPRHAEAWFSCGVLNNALTHVDEAIHCYRQAITARPDWAEAHNNLGNALYARGLQEAAIASLREALRLQPDFANAHNNLGIVLAAQNQMQPAIASFRAALQLRPDYAFAHNNLGNALFAEGELTDALQSFEAALRAEPNYAEARANLGNVLYAQGRVKEALTHHERALSLKPDYAEAHSNYLMCLNYLPGDAHAVLRAHQEWAQRHAPVLPLPHHHKNRPDPTRRLRIGYISPDLRAHSVRYFLEPLLTHHDAASMEVYCYSDVIQPDDHTVHLRSLVPHWRHVRGLSDDEVARHIETDEIDILVDLAGHTSGHRLRVFARRPAPVQITYLGYPNTTGLTAMDYRITDAWADPSGTTEHLHTETLLRLPCGFLCYAPPPQAPAVAALPAREAGRITFGSFNSLSKMTEEVVAVWAQVLHAVPNSRLLLKHRFLQDTATRARYLHLFNSHGIDAGRLIMEAYTADPMAHLAQYGRVDIGLDPFPYNGATTTCEALWMGVPVVSLAGDVHAGRVGVSLLNQVGLRDRCVGEDTQAYVTKAASLSADLNALEHLRAALRPRMAASSLCDGLSFTHAVEAEYRQIWQRWCADADRPR